MVKETAQPTDPSFILGSHTTEESQLLKLAVISTEQTDIQVCAHAHMHTHANALKISFKKENDLNKSTWCVTHRLIQTVVRSWYKER